MKSHKLFNLLGALVILSLAMAACQPQKVVETVVVTEIVEKEGATQVVEKIVEKVITATPVPPAGGPPEGETPQPARQGDLLRFAILSDMDGTNIWYLWDTPGASYWNYAVQNEYWPSLYQLSDVRWDFIPWTADGFPTEVTKEGDFYVSTVKLKKGLVWNDGSAFSAGDVVFTADVALSFRLQENWLNYSPDYLDHAEALDPLTIKFYFRDIPGLPVWQYGVLQSVIVNKTFWEPKVKDLLTQVKALDSNSATYVDDLATLTEQLEAIDPTGEPVFGPWQMKKWEVGAYVENILNPKNWFIGVQIQEFANGAYREFKPDGSYDFSAYGDPKGDKSLELTTGPFYKSAIYSVYDQDAATLALRNNDVDFILNPSGLPQGVFQQLQDDPNITLVQNGQNGFRYIEFNMARPFFSGTQGMALRQAIACQMDLNFLTENVLQRAAKPVYTLVPEGLTYWFNPNVPVYCKDKTTEERINEAARIMEEAGFTWETKPGYLAGASRDAGLIYGTGLKMPDGSPFPEIVLQAPPPGYDPLRATTAVYLEQWIRQLGIPVTAVYTPFNTIRANENAKEFDIIMLGWGLDAFPRYLCDFFTGTTGVADGSDNLTYVSPKLAEGCAKFMVETDMTKARDIAFELQNILATELPYITLFTPPMYDAFRNLSYPYTQVFDGLGPGYYGLPTKAMPAME